MALVKLNRLNWMSPLCAAIKCNARVTMCERESRFNFMANYLSEISKSTYTYASVVNVCNGWCIDRTSIQWIINNGPVKWMDLTLHLLRVLYCYCLEPRRTTARNVVPIKFSEIVLLAIFGWIGSMNEKIIYTIYICIRSHMLMSV